MNLPKAAREELGIGEDGIMPPVPDSAKKHSDNEEDENDE